LAYEGKHVILHKTALKGTYILDIERLEDQRGFFARAWCKKEFAVYGLNSDLLQSNLGFSKKRGTLRGMHYQVAPCEETKLVRCTMGAIYDVALDLRRDSPTYQQWIGVELTADNRRMLYIPEGCAHGYQTLVDKTEIVYQAAQFYAPECARGVRYDDPTFGIQWPLTVQVISDTDKNWPDYLL
jgi:dTDP-4-dehydrorhamnose 3,5-epimerase